MQNLQWFAIRVTYSREMKFKAHLDALNIKNFIPMQYKEILKNGQTQRVLAPIIHNLVFVLSTRQTLDEMKQGKLSLKIPIRYIMDKTHNTPIIISDTEMKHFIAVCGTMDEQLIYLTKIDSTLKKGEMVRITGGIFAGVKGRVVRIKKDHRVMVLINHVMAVVTAFINPILLEPVDQ